MPPGTVPKKATGLRNFPIVLDVDFHFIGRRRQKAGGLGKTVSMTAAGVVFTGPRELPCGSNVELSIRWPAKLNGSVPLQLIVRGRVVSSTKDQTMVVMRKHKFRTQALSRTLSAPAPERLN